MRFEGFSKINAHAGAGERMTERRRRAFGEVEHRPQLVDRQIADVEERPRRWSRRDLGQDARDERRGLLELGVADGQRRGEPQRRGVDRVADQARREQRLVHGRGVDPVGQLGAEQQAGAADRGDLRDLLEQRREAGALLARASPGASIRRISSTTALTAAVASAVPLYVLP